MFIRPEGFLQRIDSLLPNGGRAHLGNRHSDFNPHWFQWGFFLPDAFVFF